MGYPFFTCPFCHSQWDDNDHLAKGNGCDACVDFLDREAQSYDKDHNPDETLKQPMLMAPIEDAHMQHELMSRALRKGLVRGFLS